MTRPASHDIEHIFLCATNEGELYPKWVAMARAHASDSEWSHATREYVTRLMRERRYAGSRSAVTINTAAARIRDYYLRHIAEG